MGTVSATTGPCGEMNAIVYPECVCGKPWKEHGACGGYRPTQPIKNYGTIAFYSEDTIANMLFRIEVFIQSLRRLRMRRM